MVANIGFLRQIQGRSSFSMSRLPTRTTERPWVIRAEFENNRRRKQLGTQTSGTTKTLYGVSFTDGTTEQLSASSSVRQVSSSEQQTVETTGLSKRRTHFLKVRTVSLQCPSRDANTGMIVGEAGIIFQTTNGGAQWSSQPTVTFNYLYGVSFTDVNTGTAVGYENPDG